jgi:hypothetical protein
MSSGNGWHWLGADGEELPVLVPDEDDKGTLMVPDENEVRSFLASAKLFSKPAKLLFIFVCHFLACFLALLSGAIVSSMVGEMSSGQLARSSASCRVEI